MNKFSLLIIMACLAIGYLYYQNTQLTVKNKQLIQQYELTKQKEQSDEQLIVNKAKCQKDGQQFYQEKKRQEIDRPNALNVFGNQRYSYNSILNTCLVFWFESDILGNGTSIIVNHITNIYSNKDISSWWQQSTGRTGKYEDKLGNEAEFNQSLQQYGLY